MADRPRTREGDQVEQVVDLLDAADIRVDRLAQRLCYLVVLGEQVEEAELLLGLADEVLLARDADEVRVRVPVADVGERAVGAQLLVAGLEVDRGVAVADGVEVAVVHVDVDAPDRPHDADERREAEIHDVVDRDAGQRLLDDAQHEVGAAHRVGRVELLVGVLAAVAREVDQQVARDREDRGLRVLGVHADQHECVRVQQAHAVDDRPAVVVADDHDRLRGARRRLRQRGRLDLLAAESDISRDLRDRADRDRGARGRREEHDEDRAQEEAREQAEAAPLSHRLPARREGRAGRVTANEHCADPASSRRSNTARAR